MTLDLDELERKAKAAQDERAVIPGDSWIEWVRVATPSMVLALIERVRELEALAKEIRPVVQDVAENDRAADAPFTTREKAEKMLAVIDYSGTVD